MNDMREQERIVGKDTDSVTTYALQTVQPNFHSLDVTFTRSGRLKSISSGLEIGLR